MRPPARLQPFRFASLARPLLAAVLVLFSQGGNSPLQAEPADPDRAGTASRVQYLAFQVFTGAFESSLLRQNFPPPTGDLAAGVDDILRAIGMVGTSQRRLGFIPGPLSFDNTDDEIRDLMRGAFSIALEKNVAVGFHIDDSMFWGRLSHLNATESLEWLDWNRTTNTGRRLDWSSTPTKIMPQLCLNGAAVRLEVKRRAALIGEEARRGMDTMRAAGKADLFLGVIAGWETQIGRDFDSGRQLGYCALTNKGHSAANPPANADEARADVVSEFIDLWAKSLAEAGVPAAMIFSHVAFMPRAAFDMVKFAQPGRLPGTYSETINFSPPSVAFGAHRNPGFSTYPQLGLHQQIQAERTKRGNPPWASAEGTAIDPSAAERGEPGVKMETYLGNSFNHGAVLVNIFGWGVGPKSNPFRRVAENPESIAAYRKFLRGERLADDVGRSQVPSEQFFPKMKRLQRELPSYIERRGPADVQALYHALTQHLAMRRFADAEETIDRIFHIIAR